MKVWTKFLFYLVVTLGISLGFSLWVNPLVGIIFIAIIATLIFYFQNKSHQQLKHWSQGDLSVTPPNMNQRDSDISLFIYHQCKKTKEELENLHSLTESIVSAAEALPSAVITLDSNFIIQWSNGIAQELLGINLNYDKGQCIFNIFRQPEFYKYAKQGDWNQPLIIQRDNLGKIQSLTFQIKHHAQNSILILCHDVTQIHQLRATHQDLVANVSHEIRTPLTVLLGFLETLQDIPSEALTEQQRQHYHRLMHEQALRMLAIISDLLTLSTLESTPIQKEEPVDISELLKSAAHQATNLSQNKHHFVYELDPHIQVLGQYRELSSAFSNLLTNAVHYTPENGTIIISLKSQDDGSAIFSVKDTGIGIAQSDIPRITERFYRVDKSRSRASGGTGLGLAITKHIVMRHHAKLEIESALNRGSTFRIIFPANVVSLEIPATRASHTDSIN